jgi:glycosyltransferase involved in cell wall biosynthesis
LARLPEAFAAARRSARRLHALLAPRGIRIVHTHWLPQQLVAGFMRRFGYRSVWQINNNTDRSRLFGFGLWLNRRLTRWGADLLVPCSDFIAGNWMGAGVPVTTIRNAAEPLFDGPNALPAAPLRCVIAGRLEKSKGHHLAVAAVLAARRAGHDVRLDVYGGPLDDNEYVRSLRDAVDQERGAEAVRFLGFREDLRRRHQEYNFGLQCRLDPEPCSLWVCETLVDGLPLLAAANGGTPELVADGETGLLFRSGDGDDLTAKLLSLCRQPERLARMREVAFARGREHFRAKRFIAETLEAYRPLLARGRSNS